MPTELDKITSSMATDSTGMSKAWLYWFQRVIKLMGQKIDALLNASGKVPVFNAAGELEDSGLTAVNVVSTSDTSTTDNAIARMDGTEGVTIQGSKATISDAGTVNIPTGQTYNVNGSPHTHTAAYGPGGSDTQVQYNDGGVFGGQAGFEFTKATGTLSVAGVPTADHHVVRRVDLTTYWPIGYWPSGYWP